MSEKLHPSQDPIVAQGDQHQRRSYVAPSLVRYGSIFVETGRTCSAQGTDDVTKCDIGDRDNTGNWDINFGK